MPRATGRGALGPGLSPPHVGKFMVGHGGGSLLEVKEDLSGTTREKSGRGQLLTCSFSGCRGGRALVLLCLGSGFSGKPFTLSGGHVALAGASITIAAVMATPGRTFIMSLARHSVIYMYEFIPSFHSPCVAAIIIPLY